MCMIRTAFQFKVFGKKRRRFIRIVGIVWCWRVHILVGHIVVWLWLARIAYSLRIISVRRTLHTNISYFGKTAAVTSNEFYIQPRHFWDAIFFFIVEVRPKGCCHLWHTCHDLEIKNHKYQAALVLIVFIFQLVNTAWFDLDHCRRSLRFKIAQGFCSYKQAKMPLS